MDYARWCAGGWRGTACREDAPLRPGTPRRGTRGRILSGVTSPTAATPSTTSSDAFLAALRSALPSLRLLTDAADTEAYRWDETEYMHPGFPLGVAFPATTA